MSALTGMFQKTPATADGMRAFDASLKVMGEMVRRLACSMAQAPDDQDDLEAEAWKELMELGPSRYNLKNPRDHAYLREILIHKMWTVRGKDQGGDESMAAAMRRSTAGWIPPVSTRVE